MTHEERSPDAAIRGLVRGRRLAVALDTWRPGAWLELDERIRSGYPWALTDRPRHEWLTTTGLTGALRTALGVPRPPEGRVALALCDRDGRVREAALTHTAGRPALLPLVALRTADWAAPVRERARAVLATDLPGADAATLAVTAPVILRLANRRRGGTAADLLDASLRTAPADTVTALLYHRDRITRRHALDVAVDRGLLAPAELARLAAYDEDTALRDRAATAALAAGVPDETLPLLLAARSGSVRSAGVTALRAAGRPAEAEPFLHDRSALVRACARWVLRQDGRDPLAIYRAACADPATVPGRAPLGLAECEGREAGNGQESEARDAEDIAVLDGLTTHPVARVRASAVAGLRILEPQDWRKALPLLDDPSAAVVREAARTLAGLASHVPARELLTRAAQDRPHPQRAAALRVFSERHDMPRILCALRMLDDPDPRLRERAVTVARRAWWCTHRGDRIVAEECLGLLERHHDAFPEWMSTSIRKGLQHFT
ncbi:hypothetical protein [Streptomyces roseicoloratus]|uniref:PBS lyase n=1 Tax=Streptomyces roseicoloratus TaxID=2508722 RepID=A0ABY9S0H3_9ACTN|nr:hypothetical protein [Streptomyces roseicoloratus]WMX47913.1 hypothetical protein RGF97_28185 [Streptomyces roseicoloratus]